MRIDLSKTLSAALIATLLFTSCEKSNRMRSKWLGGSKSVEEKSRTANTQNWSLFKIEKSSISDALEVDGKLESIERIEMRADKRMRISAAKFKLGDRVKRGDILFHVDTKEFEQKRIEAQERVSQLNVDIKSAKAQFSFAARQLDRKNGLFEKGIVAQKELEESQKGFVAAESALKTKELEIRKAERELASAKDTVASANVVSPIEGVISSISPGGEEVNQGQSLAVVVNPTELGVSALVDEGSVIKLKVGQKVSVNVDADPNVEISGKIRSIDASVQERGSSIGRYKVFVAIPREVVASMKLRDGYAAKVRVVFSAKERTLVIPKSGIKRLGRETYAMVADTRGSSPTARSVKLGVENEYEIEVLEGLKEGSFVAIPSEGVAR